MPLIARRPAGETSAHVGAFWDFDPTFVELAGGPTRESLDGISMVRALRGDKARQEQHERLYWGVP